MAADRSRTRRTLALGGAAAAAAAGTAAAQAVRKKAAKHSAERAKRKSERAERKTERARQKSERARQKAARSEAVPTVEASYLCLVRAPRVPMTTVGNTIDVPSEITVATYNVHRWIGRNGRRKADPSATEFVISELGADVIALQEVLRPSDDKELLEDLADRLGLHVAFAVARQHKKGELGNAILSRWPIQSASTLDISHSRIERRSAVAARFSGAMGRFAVIATHLSLVDRTRKLQVKSLMGHPELAVNGPAILMGDMNAWRNCQATRALDDELRKHDNLKWPASFPSTKPMLALDRIYARGAHVHDVWSHDTETSRTASDHLPVIAKIVLPDAEAWEAA